MNYLLFIAAYGFTSYALWRVARRLGAPRSWMAWIPFLREWLLVRVAERSWKWFVLVLVPIANIYAAWVVWGDVARKLGRSVWLGRAMIVPVLNLAVLAVLAFALHPSDMRRLGVILVRAFKKMHTPGRAVRVPSDSE